MTSTEATAKVRAREGVLWREVQGEAVLLDLKSGSYFGLDEIGTEIWTQLGEHGEPERLLEHLVSRYRVSRRRCARDIKALIDELVNRGLLQWEGAEAP